MPKKQKVQFAVLLALIAVLTGAYFGIQSYNQKQAEKEEQEKAAAKITLTSFQPEDVTGISYDYNGVNYQFEKTDGEWKEASKKKLKLDQDAFESFLKSAGSITAETEVAAGSDADYGFDKPSRVVAITTTKGTSSLIFGMENEMLGQYYLKTDGSSKIYLAAQSVYTGFDKTAEDFKAEDTKTDTDTKDEADNTAGN